MARKTIRMSDGRMEILPRKKYLQGSSAKQGSKKSGGDSGSSGAFKNPPRGIPCRPRRRYG